MRVRAVVAPARDVPSMHAPRGPVSAYAPLLRAHHTVPSVRSRSRVIGAAGTMASGSASYRSDVFRKAMTPTGVSKHASAVYKAEVLAQAKADTDNLQLCVHSHCAL